MNKKHIVIFLALLVACMSIAVAADTADTTTADSQVSDTIEADTTNTIQTQASTNANEDNNKITKENKNIKEDTTSTINIDDDNFDYEKQQKTENKENIIKTTNNENKSLKTTGEPTVINITENNYSDWFYFYEENKLRFKSEDAGAKTIYIEYLPPNITYLDLYDWYTKGWDESEYSFIGNNLTLNNVDLVVFGARVTLSNMTFNYDDDSSHYMTFRTDAWDSDFHMTIDHIKVNYTGGYEEGFSNLIETNIGSQGNNPAGVTLQNSEI